MTSTPVIAAPRTPPPASGLKPAVWLSAVALVAVGLGAADLLALHKQPRDAATGWLLVFAIIAAGATLALCLLLPVVSRFGEQQPGQVLLVSATGAVLLGATAAGTVMASVVALSLAVRQRDASVSRDSSGTIDEGPEASFRCGTDRWKVKTLDDLAAKEVVQQPQKTTVQWLSGRTPPSSIGRSLPRQPFERQVYEIRVRLQEVRYVGGSREDRDIHLVVRGKRLKPTMIVEFPDPACPGAADSAFRDRIFEARAAFERACGRPPQRFVALEGDAVIDGVGFWDRSHGEDRPRGRAPNSAELHPVIGFRMEPGSGCKRIT
jgi:hypothetical protein